MDTSKTYIKMCDCEEIQELPNRNLINPLDWWWCHEHNLLATWNGELEDVYCFQDWDNFHNENNFIWLPCQDQLQEMVVYKAYKEGLYQKAYLFSEYVLNNINIQKLYCSMEQLWLAFVMREKYNKTWDGKNWTTTI